MKKEIAKLLNVKYDSTTGRMFLEMEVFDSVWKQKILSVWQELNVRLVIDGDDNADL